MLGETMVDIEPVLSIAANAWELAGGAIVFVIAIWRIVKRIRKWIHSLVDRIVESIKEQTYPIQPHANGGNSLPDTNRMLKAISERQIEIGERTARMEGVMDTHLDWHNGGN